MAGVVLTNPFIVKALDVSTAHITKQDSERLTEAAQGWAPVYELGEYAFLVYVGALEDNWPPNSMSGAFMRVLAVAQSLDCDYVRFDCDGRDYPELERFEW